MDFLLVVFCLTVITCLVVYVLRMRPTWEKLYFRAKWDADAYADAFCKYHAVQSRIALIRSEIAMLKALQNELGREDLVALGKKTREADEKLPVLTEQLRETQKVMNEAKRSAEASQSALEEFVRAAEIRELNRRKWKAVRKGRSPLDIHRF